ncbi:hypothetical protein K8T06_12210 [bacterium]|nr:hypothetical protein [bacterium]
MKARLIMNPGSRSGKGKKLWLVWESYLKSKGIAFDSIITERAGHGIELARDSEGYDTVVAVGGDGTINEVIDGIVQSGRCDLRMGVLYSGTSPDFCRFHSIPLRPSAAVDVLASGITGKIDIAKITYSGGNGDTIVSHFGCGCNVGLGASVARVSNCIRKFTGDFLGTCLAVIYSIVATSPLDLDIIIDGEVRRLSGVNNFSILKNPSIASGLRLNLDLQPDDGKLVVFAVQKKNRLAVLSVMPDFYSGKAVTRKDIFIQECSQIAITCTKKVEIEFDGDPRGFLPAEIEILPGAINLIGAGNEGV